jgi:lysozyme
MSFLYSDCVIDVSHNNGAIDFAAVAAAGIAFAFVKASEGLGFVDPLYAANVAGFAAAGIATGAYHFVDAQYDPLEQAAFFIKSAGLRPGSIAAMDWETLNRSFPDAKAAQFMYAIEQCTRRNTVGYYGAYEEQQPDPTLDASPLWLPEYPAGDAIVDYAQVAAAAPKTPPGRPAARPYDFHQYTGTGRVAGIAGNVDRSIWVGTLGDLRAWCASGALPAAASGAEAAAG